MTNKSAYCTTLIAVALLGCRVIAAERPPLGEMTSRIVIADDALWAATEAAARAALAPRTFAGYDDPAFDVTQVAPGAPGIERLRMFRQLIVVGTPADPWVAELIGRDARGAVADPHLAERRNVWARDQSVEVVVLPQSGAATAFVSVLPYLAERLDDRFRAWVRQRMFMSGANDALRDSLERTMAFTLTLPAVYEREQIAARLVAFHTRTTIGGDLDRTIIVGWRDGTHVPAGAGDVLTWRDAIAAQVWGDRQVTESGRVAQRPLPAYGDGSLEVRAAWRMRDGAPQGGPLIDRVIICPTRDRTYFLEAWLYGPGRRKYEYMLQFETILDSFGCRGARSA